MRIGETATRIQGVQEIGGPEGFVLRGVTPSDVRLGLTALTTAVERPGAEVLVLGDDERPRVVAVSGIGIRTWPNFEIDFFDGVSDNGLGSHAIQAPVTTVEPRRIIAIETDADRLAETASDLLHKAITQQSKTARKKGAEETQLQLLRAHSEGTRLPKIVIWPENPSGFGPINASNHSRAYGVDTDAMPTGSGFSYQMNGQIRIHEGLAGVNPTPVLMVGVTFPNGQGSGVYIPFDNDGNSPPFEIISYDGGPLSLINAPANLNLSPKHS
jgi:hypothetical protein